MKKTIAAILLVTCLLGGCQASRDWVFGNEAELRRKEVELREQEMEIRRQELKLMEDARANGASAAELEQMRHNREMERQARAAVEK